MVFVNQVLHIKLEFSNRYSFLHIYIKLNLNDHHHILNEITTPTAISFSLLIETRNL